MPRRPNKCHRRRGCRRGNAHNVDLRRLHAVVNCMCAGVLAVCRLRLDDVRLHSSDSARGPALLLAARPPNSKCYSTRPLLTVTVRGMPKLHNATRQALSHSGTAAAAAAAAPTETALTRTLARGLSILWTATASTDHLPQPPPTSNMTNVRPPRAAVIADTKSYL